LHYSFPGDPALKVGDLACTYTYPCAQNGASMTDQVGLLSESWNEHAQEWIDWVRAPDRQDSYWRFHRDRFLALIPPLKRDQLIVDIGCGEGRVARDLQLLERRVLGVDLSPTMCQAAAGHDQPALVLQADAAVLPLADNSVDCAIAFMSLQDIDNMPGAVREIARVLKDGASLAMAIVHPMYSSGKFSAPEKNDGDNLFIVKRTYFQPERLVSTDSHGSLKVTLFREHRPLQSYLNALTKAGLHVEEVLELSDEDEARHRDGIPMFLDIVATRPSRPSQGNVVTVVQPVEQPGTTRIKMPASWPNFISFLASSAVTVLSAWWANLSTSRRNSL
jgi:SAM-dependent methyltransferase